MKFRSNAEFAVIARQGPMYLMGACGVAVLVIGFLTITGCDSDRSRPSPAIQEDAWSAAPVREQNDSTTGLPPVVFIEYVGTPQDVVDKMLKLANVTKDDVVCDLGCGDGRIVVAAAKRYGCRAVGYDLDPLRVAEARKNVERNKVGRLVTIEQKDVLTVDLKGISVVTIYMGNEINARLIPQLRRLEAGSRIVSHDFGLADLPPDKTVEMTSRIDNCKHRIYLWDCPLPVAP